MTTPTVSPRHRLQATGVTVKPSPVCLPGKVMWWAGRKYKGSTALADVGKPHNVPRGADTAWMSREDFER